MYSKSSDLPYGSTIGIVGSCLVEEEFRGYTRYAVRVIESVHLVRPDIQIVVFLNNSPAIGWQKRLSFVRWVITPSSRLHWMWILLGRNASEEGVACLHFPSNIGGLTFSRCPAVLTVHDLITHDDLYNARWSRPYKQALAYWTHHCFLRIKRPAVVAVSRHTFDALSEHDRYRSLVMSWAYNGVDAPGCVRPTDSFGQYFLHVGGGEARKDLPTLFSAVETLFSEIPDSSLVLAGRISKERQMELLGSIASEIRPRVHFCGYVDDEELHRMYSASIGVIVPGVEGFGLSAAEALIHGRVPVVPSGSAQAEVAGSMGLQFAAGDAGDLASKMLDLLNTPQDEAIILARRRYAEERFSWEKHALHLLSVMAIAARR